MAEKTGIAWTESTWNPWSGCHKVSQGCKFCYMFREKERYGQDPNVVVRSKTTFKNPLKWKDPRMIFTCSWSDWFIEEADEWRNEAWDIVRRTPHHTYQILTKRPERITGNLPINWPEGGYKNVWLGVSVEDQRTADERIPILLEHTAALHWISYEPALGPIDFSTFFSQVDGNGNKMAREPKWIVCGGESGSESRPFNIDWARSVIAQCRKAGIAPFIKQIGSFALGTPGRIAIYTRDKKGGNPMEWPQDIRIREFPKVKA